MKLLAFRIKWILTLAWKLSYVIALSLISSLLDLIAYPLMDAARWLDRYGSGWTAKNVMPDWK